MPVSAVNASVNFLTDASSPHWPIGYVQRVMDVALADDAFADAVAVAVAPELQAVNEAAIKQVNAIVEAFLNIILFLLIRKCNR